MLRNIYIYHSTGLNLALPNKYLSIYIASFISIEALVRTSTPTDVEQLYSRLALSGKEC